MNANTDWLGLNGKVAVVTGAAGGIGREIALRLAAAGARVAALDRDGAGAEAVAAELTAKGARAIPVTCDIADPGSVRAAADRVAGELGGCEVLVNNAAIIYAGTVMDIPLEDWNRQLSVNLSGYMLCAQSFGRHMIERGGGSMIHVSSISGGVPQAYSGAYSVTKAGVEMLSRLLTVELGEHRIRSNTVSPAMIRTPLTESIYLNEPVRRRREEIVPAGRISGPADIADTVLFLASDRSSYINGQDILVDGGLSATWLTLVPRPGFEKADATAGD